MLHSIRQLFGISSIRRQVLRRAILWTLVVAAIIGQGFYFSRRENREVALGRARDSFRRDAAAHLWFTQHGGVYVVEDPGAEPSPVLANVSDRSVTAVTGKVFTQVDPVQVTQKLHDLGRSETGLRGHFTSLLPIRPEGRADAWEQGALARFAAGQREAWEEQVVAGRPSLRYMGAMVMAEDCLRCHAAQGYRVGDVRGGISVTVPLVPGSSLFGGVHNQTLTLSMALLWVAGLGVILVAGRRSLSSREERLRIEQALRQKERYQRALLDNFPFAVWLKDTESRFLSVNSGFARTFGVDDPDELAGRTDYDIAPRDLAENYRSDDRAVMETRRKKHLEEEILTEGVRKWFETYKAPVVDDRGELLGTVGFARDISERKLADAARREAELQYQSLFQANPHPMWAYNAASLRFLAVNDAAVRHYGYSEAEFLAMTLLDIRPLRDVPRLQEFIDSMPSQGISVSGEWQHRKKDGTIIDVEITSHGYYFHDQSARIVLAHDITQRKQADREKAILQAQLHQSQKMESLGRLAGGIAHDMNNVLGAIMALASVHQGSTANGKRLPRDMETVIKACERGASLVKGLLGFAREGLVEEKVLDLNALVQEQVALLERTTLQKVRLKLDTGSGLHPIKGDPAALSHGLMNLCVNAVDAMGQGGTLTLRTRNLGEDVVLLEVEDTGSGMPKEVVAKAMDPFFTTKPPGKGTGLGLSIVYSTTKAHRGTMKIQSEPGKGTCISLQFPAWKSDRQDPASAAARTTRRAHGKLRVLLVDDDDLVRSAVEAILQTLGHEVVIASGGEDALARVESGCLPEVIILDKNMPGLGGAGTLPRLRALLPAVPVLLATGEADQAAMRLIEGHQRVVLLSKPFGIDDLQRSFESLFPM